MKKIILSLVMSVLICVLVACGAKKEEPVTTELDAQSEAILEKTEEDLEELEETVDELKEQEEEALKEEEKRAEELKKAEEEKKAEELKKAEEEKKAEELKKAEEEKKAKEDKKPEEKATEAPSPEVTATPEPTPSKNSKYGNNDIVYQLIVGDVTSVNGQVPHHIYTKKNGNPNGKDYNIELMDADNNRIAMNSECVQSGMPKHTQYEYVYLTQLISQSGEFVIFEIAGTNDPNISGNLTNALNSVDDQENGYVNMGDGNPDPFLSNVKTRAQLPPYPIVAVTDTDAIAAYNYTAVILDYLDGRIVIYYEDRSNEMAFLSDY